MFAKLWNDESGIAGLEYLLLATIVGLSLVVGFSAVSRALNIEFVELSNAILAINQSYSYSGVSTCTAASGGAAVTDTVTSISFGTVSAVPAGGTAPSVDIVACP